MFRKVGRSAFWFEPSQKVGLGGRVIPGSWLSLLVLTILLFPALAAAEQSKSVEVTDLRAEKVNALDFGGSRALVFIFVSTECPISNSYAPEYRRLASEYATNGISFRLVYPNADESVDDVRKHLREYNLPITAFRDPKHELVNAAQARVTPEAAIYLRGKGWIYHGRIDDRFVDFGKARPAAVQHDLRDVLQKIAEGKPPAQSSTRAIGCYISGTH